jgi:hypothetical protein
MQRGYLDIQHAELMKYQNAVEKKVNVCRIMPAARFSIQMDGSVIFSGLVCHPMDMGGEATGVGAESCTNCVQKRRP